MDEQSQDRVMLEFKGITKRFPGVVALDGVSFPVLKGHVHAICGENGAGKSTLAGILFGMIAPTHGEILIEGQPVEIGSPAAARQLGIRLITQEVDFCPNLTVAGNIYLGSVERGLPDWGEMNRETDRIIARLGLGFGAQDLAGRLTVSQRQQMAIARVYREKSRIILMDEPNSSLNEKESQVLFEIIRNLKANDVTIIYISHRMEEVLDIADEITVLRDGRHIETRRAAEIGHDELVRMIVGKEIKAIRKEKPAEAARETVLALRDFNRRGHFRGIDLDVGKGEIVGLFGLRGSGIESLVRSAFGIDARDSGRVFLEGEEVQIDTPGDAARNGIAFVPADRKEEGIIPDMDVRENIIVSAVEKVCCLGVMLRRRILPAVLGIIDRLLVDCTGPAQKISNLSGGNQQKVILGRYAIFKGAKVLMMVDPTRGVDVGARAEIHELLIGLAAKGLSILVGSSEVDEILAISDRILIMQDGCITREFAARETDKEEILSVALSARRVSA
ncbi:MAG: sugar ABC transporter ATP-binding protein [Patescibacteria group bacterium]